MPKGCHASSATGDVTSLPLRPSQSGLATLLETTALFLISLLDSGREYCKAFVATSCQQVPNAGDRVGQPEGPCRASPVPGADLAGWQERGSHLPISLCLLDKDTALLPETRHGVLKKEDACHGLT